MPHRFKCHTVLLAIMLLMSSHSFAQKYDCTEIDPTGLIKKAFQSFEKDMFAYYNFADDSLKTYRTFLAEVTNLSIDLRKLPSDNSIQLAREFKKKADDKNSIWVKLSDYENDEATKTAKAIDTAVDPNQEEILIFNYRGGFIQCLKNTSESKEFRDLVYTLENDGNVSPSLIAQKIYYIKDEEFNTSQIKEFIAFDIYYSILMIIEKAFG